MSYTLKVKILVINPAGGVILLNLYLFTVEFQAIFIILVLYIS